MKNIFFLLLLNFTALFAQAQCQAAFTYSISGGTVSVTNTSSSATAINSTWKFGDGSIDWAANPVPHTYQYAGTYTLCLSITDSLPVTCQDTVCQVITITGAPNPPCQPAYYAVVDSNPPYAVGFNNYQNMYSVKWVWNFGDGNYDSTSGPYVSHLYAVQDTFITSLTVITTLNDTCTYFDTIVSIPCWQILNTSFAVQFSSNTVTFVNSSSGAATPSYNWSFGDGGYSTLQSPTHTYQFNGSYPVCLSHADSGGACSEMYCDTIMITTASQYPCTPLFTYLPDSSGPGVNFIDNSTMNIVSWNWQFPGGTPSSSTAPSQHVNYPAGTYTATLTVTNQSNISCTYSNVVNVGTNCFGTQANFSMQPDSTPHVWMVNNTSSGAQPITYTWNWGDGSPNSTGVAPAHTYTTSGWYTICLTLTDANGCGSSYCSNDTLFKFNANSTMVSVFVVDNTTTTGIGSYSADHSEVSVYPNPSNGEFTIYTSGSMIGTASVYNAFGQLVHKQTMDSKQQTVNLSGHPEGVYWVKLAGTEKTFLRKVVVMK